MAIRCRSLDAAAEPAWDAFVRAQPDGTFFHLSGWRHVIERAFGHRTDYVLAERDGVIAGVLPLAQVKTWLFGNSLISVPFCVYGGPLAAEAEAEAALIAHATELMRSRAVPVLEFRYRGSPNQIEASGWHVRNDLYVTFRRNFIGNDESNLKAIPRKQRAMVRKAIDRGLISVLDFSADRLHGIYAESVRNLGTPVFSQKYFRILMEVWHDSIDIVTVLDGETAIASVMNFYFRDEVLPYYGGGRAIARGRYGNDFMYWEVMRRAAARGFRLFDFGRSKRGTGSFAFKKNWGFEPEPLHYCFRLEPGAAIPNTNPLNPKFQPFIAAWKHLPVPLANVIGPHIVRGVG
jgi:FemAB-related protein (PEP-CTERM system-associated)